MIGHHVESPAPDPRAGRSGEAVWWRLQLRLPEHWFLVSGDPERDRLEAPADVDTEVRHRPELESYREFMLDPLLGLSGRLESMSGGICAAFRWDLTDYGLVTATVVVRCYERPAGPVDTEVATMRSLASVQQSIDEFAPHVSEVDLPLGRAVRREVVIQPPATGDEKAPLRLTVDHWVPLDFAPTRTLGIRAGTSNLAMALTLVPEFDAIAEACVLQPRTRGSREEAPNE